MSTRVVGDVGLAEDLAQDAFVQTLEQWLRDGVPDKPGAWLTATARRRAIERIRRESSIAQRISRAKKTLSADGVTIEIPSGAALAPCEPEVLGLLGLMEIQASRTRARIGRDGEPILLLDQDRSRRDWVLIRHALAALTRATERSGIPAGEGGQPVGPYVLQAQIAACHARARPPRPTGRRWPRSTRSWVGCGPRPSSSSTGRSPSRMPLGRVPLSRS